MEKEILEALESLGLSDKEIKVYISLLELGESPVNKITLKSELNRVTVYPVLKSLIEKGFVSQFTTERKKYFKAISPKQIIDILKEKEEKIKYVLPLLEEKQKKIISPTSVELYKGSRGFFSFYDKLYSGEDKKLFSYGNFKVIRKLIPYQIMHARKLRIRRKIYLTAISAPVDEPFLKDKRYRKITDIRINPVLKDVNVYIVFGKKIIGIFETTKELYGIIIYNEEIAKYHKFIFNSLIKKSKKI